MDSEPSREWWREAVAYQIYPRSFQDSNGDGIGDLEGIIQRLDYLNDGTRRSLGVDAVWLSPTFPSPMADFGYDVADYCDVHPDFGTLETMDRLIAECHRRGIRVLLDWVPNHTSDRHPWFIESRSSRSNPKRDWYIWRDPKPDGSPPNNWRSVFGGPAWTFDETTGQYYLHSFLKEQPDLNWRNPEVEQAMFDTLRFWFKRGVDGFRIDVIGRILKHPDLPDNPPNPEWQPGERERFSQIWVYNHNFPDVFEAVKRIRRVFDEYPGTVSVGEVFGTPEEIARFYGDDDERGLHLAFNFHFIHEHGHVITPWEAPVLRRIIGNAEASVPSFSQPCFALNNHDRSRFITRHDADGRGRERARAAPLLLLGLRNTPFLYYGEEIGMADVDIPPERQQDPARFRSVGRDPERTPMQWDTSPGRGFTSGEPWLPFGPLSPNVAEQDSDPDSLLNLYRSAVWLRKELAALRRGSLQRLGGDESVVSWLRVAEGAPSVFVAVNTSTEAVTVDVPFRLSSIALCTDRAREGHLRSERLELPPLGAAWVVEGS
ncbi:MAG: oligo-1,6-glucosidase [Tepidiforma sp.]|nr:MAG: oligo-1,6-glucosidase [Tepidiforma sp.]